MIKTALRIVLALQPVGVVDLNFTVDLEKVVINRMQKNTQNKMYSSVFSSKINDEIEIRT